MKGKYTTLWGSKVEVTDFRREKKGNIVSGHTDSGLTFSMSEKEFNKLFTKIQDK